VPTADARRGLVPLSGGGVQQISVSSSTAPYLNLYPLPNGREYGDGTAAYTTVIPSHSEEVFVSGKLDAYLSSRWRTSFRGTGSGAASDTRDT
jgi:hypothetical protein